MLDFTYFFDERFYDRCVVEGLVIRLSKHKYKDNEGNIHLCNK